MYSIARDQTLADNIANLELRFKAVWRSCFRELIDAAFSFCCQPQGGGQNHKD